MGAGLPPEGGENTKGGGMKAGFTLVELMVVAIIVAILAAVAVPLMMANRDQAIATEGQTGLGVVRTAMNLYKLEHGHYPVSEQGKNLESASGLTLKLGDLDGKYFKTDHYVLTTVTPSNYVITATCFTNSAVGKTVTIDETGAWGGTLL